MNLRDLLKIKQCCGEMGISLEEMRLLVDIWQKMHQGLAFRSATEMVKTTLYTGFVQANEDLCSAKDEDKKRAAAVLLKARMVVQSEGTSDLHCATPCIPQAFSTTG